jgi:Heat induced stress protein YflT domain
VSQVDNPVGSSIVAVYPDHPAAEHAVRQLHQAGFALGDLSIVGRDFQTSEEPVGFVSAGDYATAGAKTGAWFGGLFGLVVGAAFLVLPGVGPIVVAGPLAAAVVAGLEGALAGTALGGLAGALVGVGVPKERALKYETQVKGGNFLVIVRGNPEVVARARNLLGAHTSNQLSVYSAAAS